MHKQLHVSLQRSLQHQLATVADVQLQSLLRTKTTPFLKLSSKVEVMYKTLS